MRKGIGLLVVIVVMGLAAYHALMYYDNNFPYGRMRETPAVKPHEEPLLLREAGGVPVDGGDAVLRNVRPAALKSPVDLADPGVLARGKAVYFIFCAQCHGPNYDGKGTVGQSFMPLPTDFRSPAVQGKPPGELFKSVSYGIPGGRQPPLDTTITIDDRWCVIAFVKSLAPIMPEAASRDRGDGRATGQPQGLGPEAYLFSTSQGARPEDARKDGHIRGRSRRLVHNAG